MKLFSKTLTLLPAVLLVAGLGLASTAEAAMKKMDHKMMMHKCKAGDKKCEMKMMKMKHK